MSDSTSPRSSDDTTCGSRRAPHRAARFLLRFGLLVTLVLLTTNVWLLWRQLQSQRTDSCERAFWILNHAGASVSTREQAFRQLVADGNTEWRSAYLEELNLAGISLPGANLRGGGFVRANFSRANLERAQFRGGSLEQADFTDANLQEANFSETFLLRAHLKGANLRRANLRSASIEQAQAEGADFALADLSDANCLMANLSGAKLDGANLSGARLESAVLNNASLSLTRLDGADLKHAEFKNANWWRARGLRTDQLESLKEEFPPTADAPATLKEDYEKWQAENGR